TGAPRASRPTAGASGRARRRALPRPAGGSGWWSASSSSRGEEDDGKDGDAARERERVDADEPVLRAADLDRAEVNALAHLLDRACDDGLLDVAAERTRDEVGGAIQGEVVRLVPVELPLEHFPRVRHAPPCGDVELVRDENSGEPDGDGGRRGDRLVPA